MKRIPKTIQEHTADLETTEKKTQRQKIKRAIIEEDEEQARKETEEKITKEDTLSEQLMGIANTKLHSLSAQESIQIKEDLISIAKYVAIQEKRYHQNLDTVKRIAKLLVEM